MSSSSHSTSVRNHRKSKPCRLYAQGHCRFGDKCRFGHDASVQLIGNDMHPDQLRQSQSRDHTRPDAPSSPPCHETSDARPRTKRGDIPCRAWKAGTCAKGSKCWFAHDMDVQKPGLEPSQLHEQKPSVVSCTVPLLSEEGPSTSSGVASLHPEQNVEAERVRALEAEAAARERANAIAREEAAKTINQVVCGSIVTYSAGLDVPNLITGFETCTLRVENLPLDVKEDDIHALLLGQGLDVNRFHFLIKKKSGRKLEAHIVTDITSGRALALGLDGFEFQEETLVVEMSATNSLEGMNAAAGQNSEILTISWRVPSACYVAEYVDIAAANAKVKELDRSVYGGRRIKVQMNAHPPGRHVPNLRLNAIKINNLPATVTDEDVIRFANSPAVKRLRVGGIYTAEHVAGLVRYDIERVVPGGLRKFDDPPSTCTMDGTVFARAHFSSWEEAHSAYTHLSDKRYGTQPIWLRLPDPMYFTLVIPMEQYKAQKGQWDSLSSSIKDRKACTLNVRESGNVVHIRLSGSVKEATGALKVRVENLARGDKVEGWHRLLGFSGNPFIPRVYLETGAYLRADWKRQSLKVYGTSGAVDLAREMIKGELERLAAMDYTVILARHSVGFFVREGIQQLKETLGENNVRFAMASRKIIVSGGEEARHALDRLITLSHKDNCDFPSATQDSQTCPICYDSVSSPHQLGCGHTYCVACLRHFILSALESDQLPLTCLGDETRCRVPIAIPTIQYFLPPASFNRLLEAAFDAYIAKHPEELKHCRTPDCTQIYRAARAGTAPQTLHCPSCFSAVCNACHEDAHDGLSCAETRARRDRGEEDRLSEAWIASQGGRVKKCPQCSVPIEKLEGCNHMTCRCGAHICWRCMGIFTAHTIYEHMHAAHGTIHDDVRVVPEPPVYIGIQVDIEQQRELLRQAEIRRVAALRDGLAQHRREAEERMERIRLEREIEERERRLREQRLLREAEERRAAQERMERFRRMREVEERERRLREQRLRLEAEERHRARAQQSGGWNCTIM